MKIIKSIATLIVCLCTTTFLHAQELKTEVARPVEIKIPASANNKPSPQPELKPQPQVAAVATEAPAAAEAPSPLTRKEDAKPEEKDKPEAKVISPTAIATPGGEAGRKTMEGKSEAPKRSTTTTPNTIDQNMRPLPTKAAVSKEQQNP